jgi:hypothetical protein
VKLSTTKRFLGHRQWLASALMTVLGLAQLPAAYGTVVFSLPCKSGLLIVADKRLSKDSNVRDDMLKIRRVDKFTAFACTNQTQYIAHVPDRTGHKVDTKLFDAFESVASILNEHPMTGVLAAQADDFMSKELEQRFRRKFEAYKEWFLSPKVQDLFVVIVFHYDRRTKSFQQARWRFRYKNPTMDGKLVEIKVVPENECAENMLIAKPSATGDLYEQLELDRKLGRERVMSELSIPKTGIYPSATEVPIERAKHQAGKFIKMMRDLQLEDHSKLFPTISPNVDVALISPLHGFLMVQPNVLTTSLLP